MTWCPELATWHGQSGDKWVVPHTLLLYFLVIYGVPWYYAILAMYLWETSEGISMCSKDSFADESIVNMLVSDPLVGVCGTIVALIVLMKGEPLNPRFLDFSLQTWKDVAKDILEICLIVFV